MWGRCRCETGVDTNMCNATGSTSGHRCRTSARPRLLRHGDALQTNIAVSPGLVMGPGLVTATPRCRHKGATVFGGETVLVENPRHGLAVGSIGMEALWLG